MVWTIRFKPKASKELEKLDPQTQRLIWNFIRKKLRDEEDPRRLGEPLKGPLKSFWRYRVGNYRLICDIHDRTITIEILKIGHRRDIYKS